MIKDKMVRVINSSNRLILKAPMSHNRTSRIELDVLEHKCLETATRKDDWLWNCRLGHLNFNDISNLKRKNMVSDLQEIHIPAEVCEECVQAKQHKNNFNKDAKRKLKPTLEIIYLGVCDPLQVDSLGGNKYFVTFIDDYISKLWTYLINKISDMIDVFTKSKQWWKYRVVTRLRF